MGPVIGDYLQLLWCHLRKSELEIGPLKSLFVEEKENLLKLLAIARSFIIPVKFTQRFNTTHPLTKTHPLCFYSLPRSQFALETTYFCWEKDEISYNSQDPSLNPRYSQRRGIRMVLVQGNWNLLAAQDTFLLSLLPGKCCCAVRSETGRLTVETLF